MTTRLVRRPSPEERELERKRAELAVLEGRLADRELELATLRAELQAFNGIYLRRVGSLYAELDSLRAKIAESCARLDSTDKTARARAEKARAQARDSAEQVADSRTGVDTGFEPSDSLRRLYREVARSVHPDLAADDRERARRTQLMSQANAAYAAGDETRLEAILAEWQSSPEAVKGDGVAAELVRVIRQIDQVEVSIARIDREVAAMEASDLYQLRSRVQQAEADGRDLLAEMAKQIELEIEGARRQLDELLSTADGL